MFYYQNHLPSHALFTRDPLIEFRELKSVTSNTCLESGSVAMPFNSVVLTPLPTPMEKTVTPRSRKAPASFIVEVSLSDCPAMARLHGLTDNCHVTVSPMDWTLQWLC